MNLPSRTMRPVVAAAAALGFASAAPQAQTVTIAGIADAAIDIVPLISGTYEQLAPRAASVRRGEHSVLVEAVSDLLTTLTVPRREKDADQVRELRRIQTSFTHSDAACSPERDDGL